MRMKRDDDSQRGDRLAPQDRRPRRRSWLIPPIRSDLVGEADKLLTVTQPVHPTPLYLFRTEKQLTAPADRPVRGPAHTVAFTTAVAIRGAGSVHRRTGMQTALALPVDSGRADPRSGPTASKTHRRRCRPFRLAASRTTAPRGVVTQVPTSAERWAPAQSTASPTPTHRRTTNRRRCRSITSITTLPVFPAHRRCTWYSKNRTCARREPAELHAARTCRFDSVWPPATRARE